MANARADLYQSLAEALAEPPDWLALPGRDWPLLDAACRAAQDSEAARDAVDALADIPAEAPAVRRRRYAELFAGPGQPRLWLYESAFLQGRVLGPEAAAVERQYRAAGLEPSGAEMPDHASLELFFLGHLAAHGLAALERAFIQQHAGRWLPALGRKLAHSGDEVFAPIGRLTAGWLEEATGSRPAIRQRRLPAVAHAEACPLCGFCVQVCPARCLAIQENDSTTALVLNAGACVGCGKCRLICGAGALKMSPAAGAEALPPAGRIVLRESPRARCSRCGQPTVSRAELDFVVSQVGHPAWLDLCQECRASP